MNDQYVQWLSGPKRGSVEAIHELRQDGQTSEDLVVLSNGKSISMSGIGKHFIVLPTSSAALGTHELDMMYPVQVDRPKKVKPQHQNLLGFDPEPEQGSKELTKKPQQQQVPSKKKVSSFVSDMIERAKKSDTEFRVPISTNIPNPEFFKMLSTTFDEATLNEAIDILIESIDMNNVRESIKSSIKNFYGV